MQQITAVCLLSPTLGLRCPRRAEGSVTVRSVCGVCPAVWLFLIKGVSPSPLGTVPSVPLFSKECCSHPCMDVFVQETK